MRNIFSRLLYFLLLPPAACVSLILVLPCADAQTDESVLFAASSIPAVTTYNDTAAVELGVKFRAAVGGEVVGLRFYKGPQNTGTHVGHLWTSTGTLLGTLTFANETASGWQEARFASPIAVTAGTTYVASYFAPAGHYSADANYFASDYTRGILAAAASASVGGNGVYRYAAASAFPNLTYNATNYWVDVIVRTGSASSSSPATVFTDDFASALGWTAAGDVSWYAGTPKNGTRSVRLRSAGSIDKAIPTTGYKGITVSFSMGAYSLDNRNESMRALYYDGASWRLLAEIKNNTVNENNLLNHYTMTLPAAVDNLASFKLRFKLNGSAADDYGYVDDVVVRATAISSPAPVPTVSLTASPTALTEGQRSTLTWSSTGATACLGANFATSNGPSGSVSVTPAATTSYRIACSGAGGTATTSATVTVAPQAAGSYYVAPPAGCLNITTYGAVSGGQDATAAINDAISAALNTQAKCLYVPAGNYYHGDIIFLRGVSVYGQDPAVSVLTASNPDNAALWDRVGSTIANLMLTTTHELEFNGLPRRDLVFYENASNFRVQNNRFIGSAGSGAVKMFNSNNGKVIGNFIDNMRAASIYMASGDTMNHVEVAYNTIRRSRDDNICVETYEDSYGHSNNINIHHNDMADNIGGRGVSIVGGHHITIDSNVSTNSVSAGFLVATEESFNNKGSYDVNMTGNIVKNAGRGNGHTGFLLSGLRPGLWIDIVRLTNNTATDNVNGNFRQEGNVANVTLSNNIGF